MDRWRGLAAAVAVVLLLPAVAQADVLGGLQAAAVQIEGPLAGRAGLGALQASDARDGQMTGATGLFFQLTADTLRVETDTRPVVAVAGAHVPGEVRTERHTYRDAELRAVQDHPQHTLLVLPGGDAQVSLHARHARLVPEPAAEVAATNHVHPQRQVVSGQVPESVRVDGSPGATVEVRGDLTLVLWSWTFRVQDASGEAEYRTGYQGPSGSIGSAKDAAGMGHRSQAYIHATNATLTVLPGAVPLDLFLLDPAFEGVRALHGATVSGRLGARLLLSEDLELRGEAMAVAASRTRVGLVELAVDGAEAFGVGGAPLAAVAVPADGPTLGAAGTAAGVALLAAAILGWCVPWTPRRRLALAQALLRKGRLRGASWLLRFHVRRRPDCIEGLRLQAEVEGRRGRFRNELEARLRLTHHLVDADWIQNARRILHLYAYLGNGDAAVQWFQECKRTDPGVVQEVLKEPLFQWLGRREGLRGRVQTLLGWEDPTGA